LNRNSRYAPIVDFDERLVELADSVNAEIDDEPLKTAKARSAPRSAETPLDNKNNRKNGGERTGAVSVARTAANETQTEDIDFYAVDAKYIKTWRGERRRRNCPKKRETPGGRLSGKRK
jgi:hypothetical protein